MSGDKWDRLAWAFRELSNIESFELTGINQDDEGELSATWYNSDLCLSLTFSDDRVTALRTWTNKAGELEAANTVVRDTWALNNLWAWLVAD